MLLFFLFCSPPIPSHPTQKGKKEKSSTYFIPTGESMHRRCIPICHFNLLFPCNQLSNSLCCHIVMIKLLHEKLVNGESCVHAKQLWYLATGNKVEISYNWNYSLKFAFGILNVLGSIELALSCSWRFKFSSRTFLLHSTSGFIPTSFRVLLLCTSVVWLQTNMILISENYIWLFFLTCCKFVC